MSPIKGKKLKKAFRNKPRIGKKTSVVWNFFRALPQEGGISRAACVLCKVIFKNPGGSTSGMLGHLERKHPGALENLATRQRMMSMAVKHESASTTEPKAILPRPAIAAISIENDNNHAAAMVGEVGETEIFEEESELVIESTSSSAAKGRRYLHGHSHSNGHGTPPDAYSMTEAEETAKSIVLYLSSSLQPISTVDNPFFKRMIQSMNNLFIFRVEGEDSLVPFISSTLDKIYLETRESIRRDIQDKHISLSLEVWTDHQNHNSPNDNSTSYLLASANFISEDWTLESSFLGMRSLPTGEPTSVENISSVLNTLLEEYEIKKNCIVNIFLNLGFDSSNKNNAIPEGSKILSLPTFPCFVDTLRQSYTFINGLMQSKINSGVDIQNECETLANKVHLGLEHPGKMAEYMKQYLTLNPNHPFVTGVTLEDITTLCKLQGPINHLVECLLDENTAIKASVIMPMLSALREMVGMSENEDMKKVSVFMEKKYEFDLQSPEIGGDKTLAICTFLDPRYKKLKILTEDQRETVHDAVMELLYDDETRDRLRDPLAGNSNTNPFRILPSSSTASCSKLNHMLSKILQRRHISAPTDETQKELQRYLREPVPILEADPCQWWSDNCVKYPKLSALAKKYLCMNACTTSARLTFTKAREGFYGRLGDLEESEIREKILCVRKFHETPNVDYQNQSVKQERGGSDNNIKCNGVKVNAPELITIKTECVELMEEEV